MPRSGSSTTALTAVVPRSRPSSTAGSALRAASRNRRTRSRSTGFQVSPSRLRSLPTMTPSMSGAKVAMLLARAPVLRITGALPASASRDLPHRLDGRLGARHRARDEDRVGQRRDDRRARSHPDGTRAEGRCELGRHVHEHAEAVRGVRPALPQQRSRVRPPEAHVALVHAGHDLAHEGRAARDRDAERGTGVPQVVDTEGAFRGRELAGDARHRSDVHGRRREQVGAVVLVAEEHAVDALLDEDLEIAAYVVDRALHARGSVVERRPGQRGDVRHRDHGQRRGEDPSIALAHRADCSQDPPPGVHATRPRGRRGRCRRSRASRRRALRDRPGNRVTLPGGQSADGVPAGVGPAPASSRARTRPTSHGDGAPTPGRRRRASCRAARAASRGAGRRGRGGRRPGTSGSASPSRARSRCRRSGRSCPARRTRAARRSRT